MLGKVLKYDILADYRKYMIVYAAMLLTSIVMGIANFILNNGAGGAFTFDATEGSHMSALEIMVVIFMQAFMLLCVIAVCMILVLSISRFYKSIMRDEGYLHHTLPVPTWQLILSKLITTYIWIAVFLIVGGICAAIISNNPMWLIDAQEIFYMNFGPSTLTETLPNLVVHAIFQPFILLSQMYFCFALGNLSNKNKLGMSVLAGFGFSVVQQIIGFVLLAVAFDANNEFLRDHGVVTGEQMAETMRNPMFVQFAITMLISIFCYIAANYIFTKKLNLE